QIHDWDGGTVLAHDGDTVGQCAYLRCVPAAGVAVALLANTGSAAPLYRSIVGEVLRDLAGVRMPPPAAPPREPVPVADTRRYTGRAWGWCAGPWPGSGGRRQRRPRGSRGGGPTPAATPAGTGTRCSTTACPMRTATCG